MIDYVTPHGRAHTRAADFAFILRALAAHQLDSIAAEPDSAARKNKLRAVLNMPGVDYDLIRRSDGTLAVMVMPEAGQTHPVVYADIAAGPARSLCTCPGMGGQD